MEIYYFILIYSFCVFLYTGSNSYNQEYHSSKNYIYFFFVFVLIIIVGLNGNNDEYSRIYLRAPTIKDFFYEGEYWTILYNNIFIESGILFVAVISFFKTLQISSQAVILFYVIISLSIISIFYKKFTRY